MLQFTKIETFLINCSFLTLFLNTILTWVSYNFKQTLFKQNTLVILNSFPSTLLIIFFLIRWYDSNHFPISNLYESLLFLTLCINTVILFIYFSTKNTFLYSISLSVPLLINGFATFCLPENMQSASPLIPALKSNWLLMHVTVMILSYASLIIGSLFSVAFLAIWFLSTKKTTFSFLNIETVKNSNLLSISNETDKNNKLFILLENLDNLSYRFIGISFPFLTIGILSGAVWANETWGSYWNWDPKETWALITWLVFAIYLHSRLIKGLTGVFPALIGSIGFIVVWICYLGVNLLGKGLHSYGWFSS